MCSFKKLVFGYSFRWGYEWKECPAYLLDTLLSACLKYVFLSIFVFSLIGVVLSLRVLEFIVYRSVPDLLSDILLRFL